MNVHQNARLTVTCRVLLVERILTGRPKVRAARELGVWVKTADKWLQRSGRTVSGTAAHARIVRRRHPRLRNWRGVQRNDNG
jgi:leucine-zipper of insertion element IS481